MSEWLAILRESVAGEWENPPIIAALATADSSGNPHVRYVVARRIDDDGVITLTSDARSAKNQHIRANPNVELSLWLPQKRQQFRIAGTVSIDSRCDQVWRGLSDATRATFFWPTPAQPLSRDQTFANAIPATVNPPPNFELLALWPQQVEHLDLNPHPHRRRRWLRSTEGWLFDDLNP
jgi:PPOX class probable FMN-dependent enzyme